MRKIFLLFIFAFLFMGLGGVGDDETKLPRLKENIKVELTDTDGYKVFLDNVSVADLSYLSGRVGKGKQIVELNQIRKIEFKSLSEKEIRADLYMKNGEKINLILQGQQKIKGKSPYGIFSIKLADVREIVIIGQ
ncbi:MAG: hypothetical protein N2999_00020 [Proteobacteria bacterium]|nr:hypothetical protein [Pseudomonadota bacterium]